MSGIEMSRSRDERIRFITLKKTGISNLEQSSIKKAFRALVKRIRRKFKRFEYIKVIEAYKKGGYHIHILFKGFFIPLFWLKDVWFQLYSGDVNIRSFQRWKGKRIAGYLVKYFGKDPYSRYSWSWDWVFKGFVGVWKKLLWRYGYCNTTLMRWRRILADPNLLKKPKQVKINIVF